MLATWLIVSVNVWHFVGLSEGQFFYVITLDQHVIHRQTREINVKSQLSDQGYVLVQITTYQYKHLRSYRPTMQRGLLCYVMYVSIMFTLCICVANIVLDLAGLG